MKIAICGDVHFSRKSSLMSAIGKDFTVRLENCIKSVEWFEQTAKANLCELVIDKPIIDDEVATAVKSIGWRCQERYFIVGNHESSVGDLRYSSTSILKGINCNVISRPGSTFEIDYDNKVLKLGFLPYVMEDERRPLNEYFKEPVDIIFSHNDIKGIQYGAFKSTIGFDIDEIHNSCKLFINGHLHNGSYVDSEKRILNLGNLTGQNFSEDALQFKHRVAILDTETMNIEFIENPYALNYVKLKVSSSDELQRFLDKSSLNNILLNVACERVCEREVREILSSTDRILGYKVTLTNIAPTVVEEVEKVEEFSVDHLQKYNDFCIEQLGNTEIVQQELREICS